jgi:hypothetical protein
MSREFQNDGPAQEPVDFDLGIIGHEDYTPAQNLQPGWRRAVAGAGAAAFLGTGGLFAAHDYDYIQERAPETVFGTVACVSTDPVRDITASTTDGRRLDVGWNQQQPEEYLAAFSTTLSANKRFQLRVTCGTGDRIGEITEAGSIPADAKGTIVTCDGIEGPINDLNVTEGGCRASFTEPKD